MRCPINCIVQKCSEQVLHIKTVASSFVYQIFLRSKNGPIVQFRWKYAITSDFVWNQSPWNHDIFSHIFCRSHRQDSYQKVMENTTPHCGKNMPHPFRQLFHENKTKQKIEKVKQHLIRVRMVRDKLYSLPYTWIIICFQ